MCFVCKQFLNASLAAILVAAALPGAAIAGGPAAPRSAGAVSIGAAQGGVTDRAFVAAPPHYLYIVERERGSFVDCGAGMDISATDASGRAVTPLSCGVTLTETIVIPAASSSAKLIIHY